MLRTVNREITEEEYIKGVKDPYSIISDVTIMGYGAYSAKVWEEDGKYYLRYETGDSCD